MAKYSLENIEEALSEFEYGAEPFLLEEDEEHQIWLDGAFIRIPDLGVDIYQGEYLQYDEEEKEYYADFSIYVFMDLGTKEVIYDEGYTSFGAAVNNYANGSYTFNQLMALPCEIVF